MAESSFWTHRILGAATPARRSGAAVAEEPAACVLLENGTPLFDPRCSACGRVFEPPHRLGERFGAAFLFLRRAGDRPATEQRLLVGTRLLIATTSCRLAPALDQHQTIVGARMLVGTPLVEEGRTLLVLFCEACGQNVTRRSNGDGRVNYQWDWLAAFEPHRQIARWKWCRSRQSVREAAPCIDEASSARVDAGAETRARLLKDGRTRSYFLARDLLFEGFCRQREMRIRALRAEAPIIELNKALKQLGATYGRDSDGQVLVFPPVSLRSFEHPSRLDSIPTGANDSAGAEARAPQLAASGR